eukprot:gnl/Spiro4/17856_TR9505_c0_g1_i1.p1 gnl/Spiro4/17856_TR9505_c0_g1~~gnl/Spiro4/17856_TR9505_c0_g1_i1.p1  ORF type:complete len:858 (+),score=256.32 gnl/Spiro4/17856_TR9505_c0_g1_i1:100-2673(+)
MSLPAAGEHKDNAQQQVGEEVQQIEARLRKYSTMSSMSGTINTRLSVDKDESMYDYKKRLEELQAQLMAGLEQEVIAWRAKYMDLDEELKGVKEELSMYRDQARVRGTTELAQTLGKIMKDGDVQSALQHRLYEVEAELTLMTGKLATANEQLTLGASQLSEMTEVLTMMEENEQQLHAKIAVQQQQLQNQVDVCALQRQLSDRDAELADAREKLRLSQDTLEQLMQAQQKPPPANVITIIKPFDDALSESCCCACHLPSDALRAEQERNAQQQQLATEELRAQQAAARASANMDPSAAASRASMDSRVEERRRLLAELESFVDGLGPEARAEITHLCLLVNAMLALTQPPATPLYPPSLAALMDATADGVLYCKLLNVIVPGTVDERAVNVGATEAKALFENCSLSFRAAQNVGCQLPSKLLKKLARRSIDAVLTFLWALVKAYFLRDITVVTVGALGVDVSDPSGTLGPDELIKRWANTHLARAGSSSALRDFRADIQDGQVYVNLLATLPLARPHVPAERVAELQSATPSARAQFTIATARLLGSTVPISPNDIEQGYALINTLFAASVLRSCDVIPSPAPPSSSTGAALRPDMLRRSSDVTRGRLGEEREERAFRTWISHICDARVDCMTESLRNGLILLKVLDHVGGPGLVNWNKVNKLPVNKFHRLENCNYAVDLCQSLGIQLGKGCTGGIDIEAGNRVATLGMVWQILRYEIISLTRRFSGAHENAKTSDADILLWANQKVAQAAAAGQYAACAHAAAAASITTFSDPHLSSALFLINLVHAVAPGTVNFTYVTPGVTTEQRQANATYAISLAWKLGCSTFLVWEDIAEVRPKMILLFVGTLMLYTRNHK